MRRTFLLVLVSSAGLVAAPTSTFAQVESGTIIVVSESQAKVVIAADSRRIGEDWTVHDDATKITILSPTLVFAACGVIADNSLRLAPGDRFVAAQVAQDVLRKFKPDPIESKVLKRVRPRLPLVGVSRCRPECGGVLILDLTFGYLVEKPTSWNRLFKVSLPA